MRMPTDSRPKEKELINSIPTNLENARNEGEPRGNGYAVRKGSRVKIPSTRLKGYI